jgi:hypothetical protein
MGYILSRVRPKSQFVSLVLASLLLFGSSAVSWSARIGASYRADERLGQPVELHHARCRLSTLTKALEAATGVPFVPARQIASDSITCIVRSRRASEVLSALASVMQYRILPDDGGGYRLDLEPAVAEAVAGLRGRLNALESELQERRRQVLLKGIAKTLSADTAVNEDLEVRFTRQRTPELLEVLSALSPGALEALAAAASEPPGPIGSEGDDYLAGRVFARRRLSSFAPGLQARIRQALESRPGGSQALQRQPDPLVGVLAGLGAFRLSAEYDDRIISAPGAAFGGAEFRLAQAQYRVIHRQLLLPVERQEAALDALWLDPERQPLLPKWYRGWKSAPFHLQVEPRSEFTRADRVLAELSRKAGISIIADRFTQTTFNAAALRLADRTGAQPAAEWARSIARQFGRKYRCEGGMLLLRSQRFVWDRYAEPPADLVQDLARAKKEQGRLELADYVRATATLVKEQVRALGRVRTDDGLTFWREALILQRQRALFTLLALVPALTDAMSASGSATFTAVPASHRALFNRILMSGEPLPLDQPDRGASQASLSWETSGGEARVDLADSSSGMRTLHRVSLGARALRPRPSPSIPAPSEG